MNFTSTFQSGKQLRNVAWNNRKELDYVDCVCYAVSAVAIGWLFGRNLLLQKLKLNPFDAGCGKCAVACLSTLSPACFNCPPPPRLPKPRVGNSIHNWVTRTDVYICPVFYLAFNLNSLVLNMSKATAIGVLPFAYCEYGVLVSGILYILGKSSLCAVLVARLKVAFKGTALEKHLNWSRFLYGVVFTLGPLLILSAVVLLRGKRKKVVEDNGPSVICKIAVPLYFMCSAGVLNMVFMATVLVTWFRRMRRAHIGALAGYRSRTERTIARKRQAEWFLMNFKYTVLTMVATLSTLIAFLVFAFAKLHFLVSIDTVVDYLCILLMRGRWEPTYIDLCKRPCTPVLRCMTYCGLGYAQDLSELMSHRQERISISRSPRPSLPRPSLSLPQLAAGISLPSHSIFSPRTLPPLCDFISLPVPTLPPITPSMLSIPQTDSVSTRDDEAAIGAISVVNV